jgi:hypothetical protein
MKLKDTQVEHVLDQLPAEVIPDDHPTVPELESVFGPHTFFIGSEGLHVVERGGGDAISEQTTYLVIGRALGGRSEDQPRSARRRGDRHRRHRAGQQRS